MTVHCFIRYEIDPFQRAAFNDYAARWGEIIPRCGGDLVGYFMPHEGADDIAYGIIGFETLGAYEDYRARLKADAAGAANFQEAQRARFIRRERRLFLKAVPETLQRRG